MKEEIVWRILVQRGPQSPPRVMQSAGERGLMISQRERQLGQGPGIQADGAWDDAEL